MRVALLLLGALATTAGAQSVPAAADVLVTIPLSVDGSLRDLKLLRGESVEDAAVSFVRSHGLASPQDDARTRQVVDQLSGLLKSRIEELQAEEAARRPSDDELPTVQLSIPLTIEGHSSELSKYEGESTEAAVERFFYGTGFALDAMRELYPQLVALVNRKLEEIQPPRKQLFEFSLTIDGHDAVARHFEGGRPLDEAMDTLRAIGINDGEFMDRVAPQIANEILNRMNAAAAAEREEAQRAAQEAQLLQQQQQQQQVEKQQKQQQEQQQRSAAPSQQEPPVEQQPPVLQQRREIFSMPLTLGDRAAVLVHYDGVTARESAIRFLSDNSISDPETVNSLLPQLLELIDNQMSEVLRQEVEERRQLQEQQAREQELLLQQQQAREQELLQQQQQQQHQQQQRVPLVSLPISLGANRAATLEYFEGDNIEQTAEAFLVAVGLGQDENYGSNHAQLVSLIQEQLATRQQQQQQPEAQHPAPLFTLPVTLSGRTFDLEYVAGQEPASVANKFCVEKHEQIRAELGINFDGNQLRECQNVLISWISERVAQIQQQQQQQQVQSSSKKTRSVDDMLFALAIDIGDGKERRLEFYPGDQPVEAATEFCNSVGIDTENVPSLVEAIQAQLAKL